jgi:hypothetical protein
MLKNCGPTEHPTSRVKQAVVSNPRMVKQHGAKKAVSHRLQECYDRWGELSAAERSYVFRLEAAADPRADQAEPGGVT